MRVYSQGVTILAVWNEDPMPPTSHRATSPRSRSDDDPPDEALLSRTRPRGPGCGHRVRAPLSRPRVRAGANHRRRSETARRSPRKRSSEHGATPTPTTPAAARCRRGCSRSHATWPWTPSGGRWHNHPIQEPRSSWTSRRRERCPNRRLSSLTRPNGSEPHCPVYQANSDGPSSLPPSTATRPKRSARRRRFPWARRSPASVGAHEGAVASGPDETQSENEIRTIASDDSVVCIPDYKQPMKGTCT